MSSLSIGASAVFAIACVACFVTGHWIWGALAFIATLLTIWLGASQ